MRSPGRVAGDQPIVPHHVGAKARIARTDPEAGENQLARPAVGHRLRGVRHLGLWSFYPASEWSKGAEVFQSDHPSETGHLFLRGGLEVGEQNRRFVSTAAYELILWI